MWYLFGRLMSPLPLQPVFTVNVSFSICKQLHAIARKEVWKNSVQVTEIDAIASCIHFDVISETLRATNLGDLQEGSVVNFERSVS